VPFLRMCRSLSAGTSGRSLPVTVTCFGHCAGWGNMSKEPYRIFISYAREDEEDRRRLEIHMRQPVRDGTLTVWFDRMIPPGSVWDKKIQEEIRTCDAVVFLVSADLLDCDYVHGVEMKIAQQRLARGEIDVLAVPIFSCLIDQTWLGSLQALWNPE